ncbi:hypothetical protein [Candidatus Uabimicrobium sp. HlEnr_7]|uniref:hypothetical protein n=1 Tax=Candidatus Uabimicrobium helgolandensis TaxID=3095367 RepID=UPI003557B41A
MKVNYLQNELTIKMVYCGPPFSGKKTNLRFLQKNMYRWSSEIEFLHINQKSIMFFYSYPPELPYIAGLNQRIEFWAMPSNDCRRVREFLLQDADGIVVVVDSDKNRIGENIIYLERLGQNLNSMGIDMFDVVTAIQINKCDLTKSFQHSQQALTYFGIPTCLSISTLGSEEGIWPTLQIATLPVRERIGGELPHIPKPNEKIANKLLKNIKQNTEYQNCSFQLQNKIFLRECIFVDCVFHGQGQIKSTVKLNINQYQILSKNIKLFLSKRKTKV